MPLGGNRNRVESNNRIKLKDGTWPGRIADIWVCNIYLEEPTGNAKYPKRKWTAEETDEQDVQIKVRFDAQPDIVLSTTMPLRFGAKSKFPKLACPLLGIDAGNALLDYLAPEGRDKGNVKQASDILRKQLLDAPVYATTKYDDRQETEDEYGYTNIKELLPGQTLPQGDGLVAPPKKRNTEPPKAPAGSPSNDPLFNDDEDQIPF